MTTDATSNYTNRPLDDSIAGWWKTLFAGYGKRFRGPTIRFGGEKPWRETDAGFPLALSVTDEEGWTGTGPGADRER